MQAQAHSDSADGASHGNGYSDVDNLVKMANQIGMFFESQTVNEPASAAQSVAGHLKMFWAPAMRARLIGHFENDSESELLPVVQNALRTHSAKLLTEGAHVQ